MWAHECEASRRPANWFGSTCEPRSRDADHPEIQVQLRRNERLLLGHSLVANLVLPSSVFYGYAISQVSQTLLVYIALDLWRSERAQAIAICACLNESDNGGKTLIFIFIFCLSAEQSLQVEQMT